MPAPGAWMAFCRQHHRLLATARSRFFLPLAATAASHSRSAGAASAMSAVERTPHPAPPLGALASIKDFLQCRLRQEPRGAPSLGQGGLTPSPGAAGTILAISAEANGTAGILDLHAILRG